MYGSDVYFISNLFYGFHMKNDSLFSHSDIPTNKQDLLKFLIFSDGVLELINSIDNLRYWIESYAKDNDFDKVSDLKTIDQVKFESGRYYQWWVETLGSDLLVEFVSRVDLYGDDFNKLDAFYLLIQNGDIDFINETMLFSKLSKTDLVNNISIHKKEKVLTLEEIQNEFKLSIQANSSEVKEHTIKISNQIESSIETSNKSLGDLSYELRSKTNKIISTLSPKVSVINSIFLIVILIKLYW
jgi:hypothetical protein